MTGLDVFFRYSKKPLPYDAEVEYIESTGTQQIDTGIIPTVLDSYFLDIMSTATSGHVGIWSSTYGSWYQVPNKWLFIKLHASVPLVQIWSFVPSGVTYQDVISGNYSINNRRSSIILSLKDKYASFTNNAIANRINIRVGEPAPDQPSIKLVRNTWTGRIYGWRVNRGESTIQECVPVRFTNENNQTEGAMYDKVTKQLFRNQGTGSFIVGPDK